MLTQQDIEAFFLDHDDPYYENIQDANTCEEAELIALNALKNAKYNAIDLLTVVKKIRSIGY